MAKPTGLNLFKSEIEHLKVSAYGDLWEYPTAELPEVAFIGRSNVGKSSLLNAIVGRKALARTSSTPGATRAVHFFPLGKSITLVDLPGYGFAKLPQKMAEKLSRMTIDYITNRPTLCCVYVLVDSRHGLKAADIDMLASLQEAGVRAQVILTKSDKAKAKEITKALAQMDELSEIAESALSTPILTSASKNDGVKDVQKHILHITEY